jgi:hypothetical protein
LVCYRYRYRPSSVDVGLPEVVANVVWDLVNFSSALRLQSTDLQRSCRASKWEQEFGVPWVVVVEGAVRIRANRVPMADG